MKRILLKLSGESLAEKKGTGISCERTSRLCRDLAKCSKKGKKIGIVIGAGNFWRGRECGSINRTSADKIGIVATVMNALAIENGLRKLGIGTLVQSALEIKGIVPAFSERDSRKALETGKVVIFCCGIGSPFFSTDTAAALRACEIGAEAILKATTVDGVYSTDPLTNPRAQRYDKIDYEEVLSKELKVMDMTAIALCREMSMPIVVFKFDDLEDVVLGNKKGTLICG